MKLKNNNFFDNFYPNSLKQDFDEEKSKFTPEIKLQPDMIKTVNIMEENYRKTLNEEPQKNNLSENTQKKQSENINMGNIQNLLSASQDTNQLMNMLLSNFGGIQSDKFNLLKELLTYFSKNSNLNNKKHSLNLSDENKINTSEFVKTSDFNLD